MIPQENPTILLVEDDPTISEMLVYSLERAGYSVIVERDGRTGLQAALSYQLNLILMDLMLPELDGLAASREIARIKPELPIIILTAKKDTESILEGFESGADDYITKPFNINELLARIEARLRRSPVPAAESLAHKQTPGLLPILRLDSDARTLTTSHGEVSLNGKEHDLLETFLAEPGHLFKREELMQRVWHQRYIHGSRTLDVHIRHLRTKLESVQAGVAIQTMRGIGYRLVIL